MLSRVAEAIYWMHRYLERAEDVARVIDVNLHLSLDAPDGDAQWEPIIQTLADLPAFRARYDEPTRRNVLEFLTFDRSHPGSILRCVEAARENARSVREAIPSDVWLAVNNFHLLIGSASARADGCARPHAFMDRVKTESHLLAGIAGATMSHGEGWHFAQLGRMLERADKTSRILDVKYFILLPEPADVGTPLDDVQWSALLRSVSALEAYRKRHGQISPDRVAGFLVLDREFPRSILFCLARAEESLRAVTGGRAGTFTSTAEQRLGMLRARLSYLRIEDVIVTGLHEFLDDLQREVNAVGDAIHETFFAARPVPSAVGVNQ